MIGLLLHLVRLCPFLFGGHRQLALENLALRQQLAVYKRTATRPKLRNGDRLFWAWLSRVWMSWRTALVTHFPRPDQYSNHAPSTGTAEQLLAIPRSARMAADRSWTQLLAKDNRIRRRSHRRRRGRRDRDL